jgi:glycosyltransferase involved in cell wall biosynthesis
LIQLRILLFSQYFWPETFRINEVVQSLREFGCDVTVLTGQPNYPDGKVPVGYSAFSLCTQPWNGLNINRVPVIPRGRGSALRLVLNYLSFIISSVLFGPWLLRGQRFDAILVYAPSPILQAIPAIWLAWLKRAKLVTWVQDLWPESLSATGFVQNQTILNCVAIVVRWIYRKNNLLLVPSQAFDEPVKKMAGDTPVIYHPNPGEVAFSETYSNRANPLILEPGFNVVFAGNLGTVQALDTVLAAAQLLRHKQGVQFIMVGSGSRSSWLQQEILRLGLVNVIVPGRFRPAEMPGIFAQASAVLVSLVCDPIMSQTVPSKIQAYLAAGRPIIASMDGEGARVVMEAGAGVACPAEDARALADAVLKLRDAAPEELEEMGRRGRSFYEHNFAPKFLAGRLADILSDLVASRLAKYTDSDLRK